MTEIPEHLLKRSKAAKAKADGDAPPADAPAAPSAAPATSTASMATTASTAPAVPAKSAVPATPVAKPDTPAVAAYKARRKIPVWAMVTLSILPVWAFMYVLAMKPVTATATGPLGDGAVAYATNCSSCHGAGGEGIAGGAYGFTNGSVMKTFPVIEDQIRWVALGGAAYVTEGVTIAGDPNREGGPHIVGSNGVMPKWKGGITDAEIVAAVCDERYNLGGGDQTSEEFLLWCAPDSPIYAALKAGSATLETLHTAFADKGVLEIGSTPIPGLSERP